MPHLFSEAVYRISDRPGLWRRAFKTSDSEMHRDNKATAYFGESVREFVRWWEVERIYSEAIGRELVTDRDLMFCDRCGDSTRAVVQFDDGVLCRACAKGE